MAATPVEQIKERLSIVDVIGGYIELKNAGKSYKGKSPFTNEKTPSFYVSPERGMYYCFSSQQGGDIFTFIEKMEGVDFKGALKILAERAHIELVPEDPKKRDARETQYALLEEATQYFFKTREEHSKIGEYIEKRGVKVQTVHSWRIGYARDEWRAVRQHLSIKGFTDEQMLSAGLIKKADQGKEPYDVFRDRIVFPIMDSSGHVVAFSGRTMKTETGIPKYVNSPETELFQKSEILYGYDKAKHGIRQYDFSLVVEGQFDLVLAHQAGYTNTVAVSGTALTKHHIMLLQRLSQNVVLALDADRAGVSAVKRSALPMLLQGMDVKVAHMPDGLDPADIVQRDPHELKQIVGKAVHVIEFLLSILKNTSKDDRTYKLRVREEILPLLVAIDNRIDREHFETIVAEHIGATKDGVHFEVDRISATASSTSETKISSAKAVISNENRSIQRKLALENHLCVLLHVLKGHEEFLWMRKDILEHLTKVLGETELTALVDERIRPELQGGIFTLEEQLEKIQERQLLEDVSDVLTLFSHIIAREKLSKLRDRIKTAEVEKDDEKMLEILSQAKEAEIILQNNVVISRIAETEK